MSERRTVQLIKRYIQLLKAIDGKANLTEIAERTGMRKATVSEYVRDLVALGLVKTNVSRSIPPEIIPVLTEKGKCLLRCFEES